MTTMTDLMRDVLRSDSLFSDMSDKDFDALIDQISPAETGPDFVPDEDVKKMLAAFWTSHDARRVIEWLLDITIRAPYPVTGQNRDDLAFAAAKHQARVAIGRAVVLAAAQGFKLLKKEGTIQP